MTVFGEPYLQMFGRDKLLAAPVLSAEPLNEKLVSLQLTENLEDLRSSPEAFAKDVGIPNSFGSDCSSQRSSTSDRMHCDTGKRPRTDEKNTASLGSSSISRSPLARGRETSERSMGAEVQRRDCVRDDCGRILRGRSDRCLAFARSAQALLDKDGTSGPGTTSAVELLVHPT